MHKTKIVGDKGSPCLTPFFISNYELRYLLFIIRHLGFLYNVLIQLIILLPNPYRFIIAKMKDNLKNQTLFTSLQIKWHQVNF